MKFLHYFLLVLLFAALGTGAAFLFNTSMGVTVTPRHTMPASPAVEHARPAGVSADSLTWVMFDPGAVGVEADTAAWLAGDYDHELRRFTSIYRPAPVYADSLVLGRYRNDLVHYLELIKDMGATALEFPMFLELVDFDKLGNGKEVYRADDPMRARQAVYREAFGSLFRVIDSMGLNLVLSSDMVVLTPELENYLKARSSGLNTANPEFWKAYRAGLEELFERFPSVDAFQIRVGEAGSFYNRPDWPYRSELWVDDVDEVRCMLTNLLETCREHGKKLIFRSWTIGMGSVGDLHTDTAVYNRVFAGLDDPDLWISTKWVQGDFYPYTPWNPTLAVGAQNRIIEFQARREYEAFSSYPLWVVPYEQYALQKALAANPHIRGFWIWTLNGGPIRRSPMSLFPHTGDLTWIDMNARGTAALASDPWLDSDSLLATYLSTYFHADDSAVTVLSGLLNASHDISRAGLAFPTAVNYRIRGLGTDVPAGIYTYWDLVLASTAVNSILYYAGADEYGKLLGDNKKPVAELRKYLAQVSGLDSQIDSAALDEIRSGLEFELSLFTALGLHKQWIMHHYRYLHTGDREAYRACVEDAAQLKDAVDAHVREYSGRLDHRSFSFDDAMREVDLSLKADRFGFVRWLILAFSLMFVFFLFSSRSNPVPVWMGPLHWLILVNTGRFDALSPAWAVIMSVASLVYAVLSVVLYRNVNRDFRDWNRSWAFLLLFFSIGAALSAWRGPMAFGFWFWTSSLFRIILFALAALLLGLHIALLSRCIKGFGRWLVPFSGWILSLAVGMGAFWSTFDERMTVVNHEAALLPNSIVHTWGFTQMFELPVSVITYVAYGGIVLLITGILAILLGRRERA